MVNTIPPLARIELEAEAGPAPAGNAAKRGGLEDGPLGRLDRGVVEEAELRRAVDAGLDHPPLLVDQSHDHDVRGEAAGACRRGVDRRRYGDHLDADDPVGAAAE